MWYEKPGFNDQASIHVPYSYQIMLQVTRHSSHYFPGTMAGNAHSHYLPSVRSSNAVCLGFGMKRMNVLCNIRLASVGMIDTLSRTATPAFGRCRATASRIARCFMARIDRRLRMPHGCRELQPYRGNLHGRGNGRF